MTSLLCGILKTQQTSQHNKTKPAHKHGEKLVKKLVLTNGERVGMRANTSVANSEVQTILYEVSYKDILYNVGNITNISQ